MQIKPYWLLLILGVWLAAAQGQDTFTLTADSLQNGQAVELDKLGWKYSPNADPRFADPQFDDRAWETLKGTAMGRDSLPQNGWLGIGWFRFHLRVIPELADVPLNLEMSHLGASEIYLDGKLIGRFGVVGKTRAEEVGFNPNALPLGVVFQSGSDHIIAVRYSNQQIVPPYSFAGRWLTQGEGYYVSAFFCNGFKIQLSHFGEATNSGYGADSFTSSPFSFVGIISLSFGILHLLLYGFFRRQRANLFYSIFLLGLAANLFIGIYSFKYNFGLTNVYLSMSVGFLLLSTTSISGLAFLYTAFRSNIPRRIWLFITLGGLDILLWVLGAWQLILWVDTILTIAFAAEVLRIMFVAIRQRHSGARIVGFGAFLLLLSPLGTIFTVSIFVQNVLSVISLCGFILSITIYLAREFALTNRHLDEQLVQVKQLSAAALEHEKVKAENDRRAHELEEARQLQLSMLPKKLPNLPHLDIAAYMKTASEVGGDYYDFHLGEDGTLTIAVGDATGHGLKAGTMVASVKSLFMTLAYHPDISHIFSRLNQTLKQMQLRGLFMAMTIAKMKENQLTISIAGMPPVWIYRAANQQLEEIMLKQLPLGGVMKYTYQQRECALTTGDVVVLMSDGLPERFNAQNEMLEDESAKIFITENAHLSSQEIINGLVKLGDEWGGERPQDDDVTFVVLKLI